MQGITNWPRPSWDTLRLISDRANIAPDDVLEASHSLIKDETLKFSNSKGFELNIGEPVILTPPAA